MTCETCGSAVYPDGEFNLMAEREGLLVRRGKCLLGGHATYAFRIFATECLSGHPDGRHQIAESRDCGVCHRRHLIPGCSVCRGSRPASREEYEATLPRVSDGGAVKPLYCAMHFQATPCSRCEETKVRSSVGSKAGWVRRRAKQEERIEARA